MADMIVTKRLQLRRLDDRHRHAFTMMHADREVMEDLGGPVDHAESEAKFDRYLAALAEHGVARWAVEDSKGDFLGYCGVMPRMAREHPLGPHFEVGWRFNRVAWGNGYAAESAGAALTHAVTNLGLTGIVSYTGAANLRSQSVMRKLGLVRDAARDFTITHLSKPWHGLVWTVPVDFRPTPTSR
jgi:RimJ/RimL family protein N-acetyltransferase